MLKKIICSEKNTLRKALKIIDKNAMGVCFIVNSSNKLKGILTDGDIRRALLNNADLDSTVTDHMNTKFLEYIEAILLNEFVFSSKYFNFFKPIEQ